MEIEGTLINTQVILVSSIITTTYIILSWYVRSTSILWDRNILGKLAGQPAVEHLLYWHSMLRFFVPTQVQFDILLSVVQIVTNDAEFITADYVEFFHTIVFFLLSPSLRSIPVAICNDSGCQWQSSVGWLVGWCLLLMLFNYVIYKRIKSSP